MKTKRLLALALTLILALGALGTTVAYARESDYIYVTLSAREEDNGLLTQEAADGQLAAAGLYYHDKEASYTYAVVDLDETVAAIGDNAFESFRAIREITMTDNVVSIGAYAFMDCLWLNRITLSANLAYIGDYAFAYEAGTAYGNLRVFFTGMTAPVLGEYVFGEYDIPTYLTLYVPYGAAGFDAPEWAGLNIVRY